MTSRFVIQRLGAQGDGVAAGENGPVYIPYALPGEVVAAAAQGERGTLLGVLEPSPLRIAPPCRHFGECGGCIAQHLEDAAYREWKREKVVKALGSHHLECEVEALLPCPPRSRRRVTFSARRTDAGMLLGFNRLLSNEIVEIDENWIAVPEIVAALAPLRALSEILCRTPKPFHLTVTATRSGLDIAAQGSGGMADAARRSAAAFVVANGFARLSVDGEIVVEPRKPLIRFGAVTITPPPGGFLQAVESAETEMAQRVMTHLRRAKKVADLFAGSGAFALQLASGAQVHAVESDAAALAALDAGARSATGLKRVTVEKRDLFRRPLTAKELNAFDGLVFDPPRAGAEDQAAQIARADIPFVAAVSCNPGTLARDLRILVDGGYRLTRVTPIDQFLWSPHVEVVALLEKPKRRR